MNSVIFLVEKLTVLLLVGCLFYEIGFYKTVYKRNKDTRINITCPRTPVAKAEAVGRLGNQLSTFVNYLTLQHIYGKKLQSAMDDFQSHTDESFVTRVTSLCIKD